MRYVPVVMRYVSVVMCYVKDPALEWFRMLRADIIIPKIKLYATGSWSRLSEETSILESIICSVRLPRKIMTASSEVPPDFTVTIDADKGPRHYRYCQFLIVNSWHPGAP